MPVCTAGTGSLREKTSEDETFTRWPENKSGQMLKGVVKRTCQTSYRGLAGWAISLHFPSVSSCVSQERLDDAAETNGLTFLLSRPSRALGFPSLGAQSSRQIAVLCAWPRHPALPLLQGKNGKCSPLRSSSRGNGVKPAWPWLWQICGPGSHPSSSSPLRWFPCECLPKYFNSEP